MKVALVHKRVARVGGLETRLLNYVNYFVDRGDEVTIFCYSIDSNVELPEGVEIRQERLGAMPKPYRSWYFNHKLNRTFNRLEFDFSLALGRTSQQMACLAPGDHLGFLKALGRKSRKPKDIVQINLDKISFANSRIIFPCSDLVKQNLINLYNIPEHKLFTLLPPLNTDVFNTSLLTKKEELRVKYNMSAHKKTFVIVSTAHRRKGVPLLIRVFRRLKDFPVELKIVGKPRVRTSLPNVEYLGYLNEVNEIFTAADFSIHPAKYEPFGQVISESLACGTPVVISQNTGWSTNLPDNYGNVVDGFKVNDWVEAIKKISNQEFNIPSNFSEIHELSIEKHMEKMLQTYKDNI